LPPPPSPSPPPPSYLDFVLELSFYTKSSSDGRRLQSAAGIITVRDLVSALTATLPGVTAARLLPFVTGPSPTLTPPLFSGLSQKSLWPTALDAALPTGCISVTVRVYDGVCADAWVSRLSPLDRAAWAINHTAALNGPAGAPRIESSRLAVPPPCFVEPPPSPPPPPIAPPTCLDQTLFECQQKCHRRDYVCEVTCKKKKERKERKQCKKLCAASFSKCKSSCIACDSVTDIGACGSSSVDAEMVEFTLEASGSVSDYSDSDISSLQQHVAAAAGVDQSLVTIAVTAGSVIITATIAVPTSMTADEVQTSLSSALGTADAASKVLSITVVTVLLGWQTSSPAFSESTATPAAEHVDSTVTLIGGAAAAVALLAFLLFASR